MSSCSPLSASGASTGKGFVAGGALLLAAAGLGRVPDAFGAAAPQRGGRALLLQLGRLREPEDVPGVHEGDRHRPSRRTSTSRTRRCSRSSRAARAATTSRCRPATWSRSSPRTTLLTPIDWSKLPNVRRNIDPKFRKLPFDPQDRYSVAKDWGTTGFVYRTDLVKERPTVVARSSSRCSKEVLREGHAARRHPRGASARSRVMIGYSYNTDDAGQLDKVEGLPHRAEAATSSRSLDRRTSR